MPKTTIRTCHLHIGMNKAGSSAIQHAFQNFQGEHTRYLDFVEPNHSIPLFHLFSESGRDLPVNRQKNLVGTRFDRYKNQLKDIFFSQLNVDNRSVIISAEGLSSGFSRGDSVRLISALTPYFDSIRIYAYVRRPIDFMTSALQQSIKHQPTDFRVDALFPRYSSRFSMWEDIPRVDSVRYRLYDRSQFTRGNIAIDFSEWLDTNVPDNLRGSDQINRSLSAEAFALLYVYRRARGSIYADPERRPANHQVISLLSAFPGNKLAISPSLIEYALHRFRDEIDWMQNRLPKFMVSHGYPYDKARSVEDQKTYIDSEQSIINLAEDACQPMSSWIRQHSLNRFPNTFDPISMLDTLYSNLLK